jgi:hypothetical protein
MSLGVPLHDAPHEKQAPHSLCEPEYFVTCYSTVRRVYAGVIRETFYTTRLVAMA